MRFDDYWSSWVDELCGRMPRRIVLQSPRWRSISRWQKWEQMYRWQRRWISNARTQQSTWCPVEQRRTVEPGDRQWRQLYLGNTQRWILHSTSPYSCRFQVSSRLRLSGGFGKRKLWDSWRMQAQARYATICHETNHTKRRKEFPYISKEQGESWVLFFCFLKWIDYAHFWPDQRHIGLRVGPTFIFEWFES